MGPQVALGATHFHVSNISGTKLNALMLPPWLAGLSAAVLILQTLLVMIRGRRVRSLWSLAPASPPSESQEDLRPSQAFVEGFKNFIDGCGGVIIFTLQIIRLVACIALLGLFSFTLFLEHEDDLNLVRGLALITACAYTVFLALACIVTDPPRGGRRCAHHLVSVLAAFWLVYAYRNIWPLLTFTLEPQDRAEGPICWAKMTLLTVAGVLVPLFMPSQYVPLDLKEPSIEPNPEQTCSWGSFIFFSFLDSTVYSAYGVPHLAYDQLPPLADYDYTEHLVRRSYPHLDVFAGAKRRHMFWGLMTVFGREFVVLAVLLVLSCSADFLGPFAINRLLRYIEDGGADAFVRPWVWIIWFFIGPMIHSITMQCYTFINTRTLARTEGIITQLVFDHALRIRIKADDHANAGSAGSIQGYSSEGVSRAASPTTLPDSLEDLRASTISNGSTLGAGTSQHDDGGGHEVGAKDKAGDVAASSAARLSPDRPAKADNLLGRINNLVTTDLGNITEGRDFLFLALYAPLDIVLCTSYLYYFLGWSTFVGLAVMLLLFPLPGYLAKWMQTLQIQRMEKTDSRVQTVSEIMSVLRMVKLFGWERKVKAQVDEKRVEELKIVFKRKLIDLASNNLNYLLPLAHMISTYMTYTLVMKKPLSASLVFSTLSIFDWMRFELNGMLSETPHLIQAKVSLDRLQVFLRETELLDGFNEDSNAGNDCVTSVGDREDPIGFRDAIFVWTSSSDGTFTPSRRNFNLRIQHELLFKRGSINLILGPTGSGKTSLLMALLGEMHFKPSSPQSWFNLPRNEGVAYAAQESWVQNETIRNNILFGAAYDEERYKKVIYQCCLSRDLELFNAGDETEVGEKGLTLSGGQKARVTLARAIYSSASILLLDDVLAALDVHTAKWIVEKCLQGDLVEGRTVLLVTHNIAMTSSIADFVVSLGTDGRIASQGTVSDAIKKNSLLLRDIREEKQASERSEQQTDDSAHTNGDRVQNSKSDGKLIVAEEMAEGHVGWPAMRLFFASLGGRWPGTFWMLTLGAFFACELMNTISTWFLGYWANQYELHESRDVNVAYYMTIYASLLGVSIVMRVAWFILFAFGHLRACRSLHQRLLDSVFGATLRWLDTTPTSRIIARCTQDIRALDGPISDGLSNLINMTLTMLLKLSAVILFTPSFLLPGVLLAFFGGWIGQVYIKAQLSVKREMSVAKAPVLAHFGAAMAGLVSIRAYGVQGSFREESMHRINRYTRAGRTFYNLNRWVCIRIDAVGGLFSAALGAYLIYGPSLPTAADTGFSMTMAFGFSSMILWWVRVLNDFEVAGNSLERIQEYIVIEQEPEPTEGGVPPAYWPASGDLRVEKLSARYSPDGPKVLHEISFHIKSGERVGVVGRTGSGKSSLTLSLLRCIVTEGAVYYDGLPTASLNLDELRSRITIIPQVPELLSGTLRQNLDPFSQHDDSTLNDALRASGLFSLQGEADEGNLGLDSQISSGGGNLSVGQRQILALARAIVRQSKLLILDEATSAIDYETDNVIQSSLRRSLSSDVTVLTVAHRLQTIMDADKIIVLDAGRLVEFDSPVALLKKEGGLLKALVDESGDKELLYAMAARSTEGDREQ